MTCGLCGEVRPLFLDSGNAGGLGAALACLAIMLMARNFIQPGDTLTLAAPYDVTSGSGLLVGALFGVAVAAAGNPGSIGRVRLNGSFA